MYTIAEPLYRRAISIREQLLGAIDINIATRLNSLANLYQQQGKYAEAAPLLRRALAIYECILGQKHPTTQIARKNYATILQAIKHDADAKRLEEGS